MILGVQGAHICQARDLNRSRLLPGFGSGGALLDAVAAEGPCGPVISKDSGEEVLGGNGDDVSQSRFLHSDRAIRVRRPVSQPEIALERPRPGPTRRAITIGRLK